MMALVSCCLSSMLQRSESRCEGLCCALGNLEGEEDFQILVIQVCMKFGLMIATWSLELPILLSRIY